MSNARLPVPVRELLEERLRDADARRLWRRLQAKRAVGRLARPRAEWLALVAALVSATVVFALVHASAPSVLRLEDGRELPKDFAVQGSPVVFDDGSRIELQRGARLDLLESKPTAFAVALRAGTITFDVTPGGPRSWKVECGPVTVEVVGTRFTLTRSEERLEVSVVRGAVLVSGPPVPDHVVRLGASESIVVELAPARAMALPSARSEPRKVAPAAPSSEPSRAPAPPPPRLETAGTGAPAAPSATGEGTDLSGARLAEQLARADAARSAGRFAEAAGIMESALASHGSDPSAPLAEFSLGRLYLESLGNPGRAVPHLARAVARGLPVSLAEDAHARLVEAHARAGDAEAAKSAATRYRTLYPEGRRLADVNRWIGEDP